MELVSIVMPSFNASKWIEKSIVSILSQNYKNIELIIIDGGSNDGTQAKIQSFSDKRLNLIQTNEISFVKKLNIGINISKGEWILRMDADDICHPSIIKDQLLFIKGNPSAVFVCPMHGIIFNDILIIPKKKHWNTQKIKPSDYTNSNQYSADAGTLFKKSLAIRLGGYDINFEKETSLWFKLLNHGNGFIINKYLYFARISKNQMSERQINEDNIWFDLREKYDPEAFSQLKYKKNNKFILKSTIINRLEKILIFNFMTKNYFSFISVLFRLIFTIGLDLSTQRTYLLSFIRRETLRFWKWEKKNLLPNQYKIIGTEFDFIENSPEEVI